MILRITGDLKPYYAQTLCMIFFPGAKFPENEMPGENVPEPNFHVQYEAPHAHAQVTLSLGGKSETRVGDCNAEGEIDGAKARQIAAGVAFCCIGFFGLTLINGSFLISISCFSIKTISSIS